MPLQHNHDLLLLSTNMIRWEALTDLTLAGLTPPVYGDPTPIVDATMTFEVLDDQGLALSPTPIGPTAMLPIDDEDTNATNYYEAAITATLMAELALGQRVQIKIVITAGDAEIRRLVVTEWAQVVVRP